MKNPNRWISIALVIFAFAQCPFAPAQQIQEAQTVPQVFPTPVFGTFYLLQFTNSPPLPFDPYQGQLTVYEWKPGVYVVDDSQVSYAPLNLSGAAGMSLMSMPPPCDPCVTNSESEPITPPYLGGWTTNSGLKFGPVPLAQAGVFSTWLQDADTNSAYEIYEKFQLSTNLSWLRIAAGEVGQTNFSWGLPGTNLTSTGFYRAADALDSDWDGLSDAFEELMSHTLPLDEDSDNDGIADGDEDFNANGIPDSADYARLSQAVIFSSRPLAYEGGLDGEITVLLPFAAPTNGTTITLHLGGTAEFVSDYELFTLSGQRVTNDFVFNAGEVQKKLSVRPINDLAQASRFREVSLALAESANYPLDPRRAAVSLIENDLPLVSIVASDPKAAEAAVTATNKGEFIIRRYGTNGTALTVNLSIGGSATNGTDYSSLSMTQIIPAGSNEIVLTVTPLLDTVFEDTETVTLTILANATYTVSTNNAATVNILDDDLPVVRFAGTDPVATEYNSLKTGTVTLWRTGNVAKPLTVPLAVGGTASRLSDYQILTNNVVWTGSNVTFAAGSSNLAITVKPLADSLEEQAETVVFTIKGSVAYKIGSSNAVTVFVDDDHTTRYQVVQRKQASVYEPGVIDSPAVYDLLRWGRSSLSANVPFEMGTNAGGGPIRTFYYRSYGDISGENFVFAPFATKARLNATALSGGSQGGALNAIHLKVPSIDNTIYAMWFRPRWEYVRIEVLNTNAVEGTTTKARLRFSRLYTGPRPFINLTITGNAGHENSLSPDHDWPQALTIIIPTNSLVVETNIAALTDGFLEGWETMILTPEPMAQVVCYDLRSPYMVFLREDVATLTGLPETDTDRDGMSDRWEVANDFDPFTPGEEAFDPDKDGLTNAEESAFNTNPRDADSDNDGEDDFVEATHSGMTDENYLEVKLFTQDTGKVNNGMNCAVCHTTQFKVGDYTHFSPGHGYGTEKSFCFKRGTNYPIYLTEMVRNLITDGPTTGTPTTTAKYTAGIVPVENEPRAFVVNDVNNKLGTNKLWSNFPTDPSVSIGSLVVPKIEVFWTNVSGNVALSANTNAGGGMRVFPDALSPTDNVNRNRVQVRVKTTPPLNGQNVRLKSFDVDDPTREVDPLMSVDTNGEQGKDNRGTPQEGALANITLTLNSQGEATTDFFTTWQPGDNFRVAALLDTVGAAAHLDLLQTTNPAGAMFVTADQNSLQGFVGGLSPMLTVWRKLHLEIDSMDAPPTSGPEANFRTGTVVSVQQNYPIAGRSRLKITHSTPAPPDDRFENGKLAVPNVGTYPVLKSFTAKGQARSVTFLDIPVVVPLVPFGTTIRMYDDDDQFLADDSVYGSDLQMQSPQVPADSRSGEFTNAFLPAYAVAYILPVDAKALGLNNQRVIPFKRNAHIGVVTSPFDVGTLELKGKDRPQFWAYSIVIGYEGDASEDGESDKEEPLLGENADDLVSPLDGFCVVYVEGIRDKVWGLNRDENVIKEGFENHLAPSYETRYLERLYAVMIHELGHAPGGSLLDHFEGGLMIKGSSTPSTDRFSAKTIRRFRSALKWTP